MEGVAAGRRRRRCAFSCASSCASSTVGGLQAVWGSAPGRVVPAPSRVVPAPGMPVRETVGIWQPPHQIWCAPGRILRALRCAPPQGKLVAQLAGQLHDEWGYGQRWRAHSHPETRTSAHLQALEDLLALMDLLVLEDLLALLVWEGISLIPLGDVFIAVQLNLRHGGWLDTASGVSWAGAEMLSTGRARRWLRRSARARSASSTALRASPCL